MAMLVTCHWLAQSQSGQSQTCAFFPIAISSASLSNAVPGVTELDVLNGTGPGQFGWLSWGGSPSEPTLVVSLTPPGNSVTYINPDNPDDHQMFIGDWISSKPGVSNSKKVRDALDALKGKAMTIPVWDQSRGSGEKAAYRVSGFATVRLLNYQLPQQNRITTLFLGFTTCGQQNQAPIVNAGADQNIILSTVASISGSVSDDSLPAGSTVNVAWSQVSGAGVTTFLTPNSTNTTASFSEPGTYVLRLTASDSELSAFDEVVITVNRENHAPGADDQSLATAEDVPINITLTGSDADNDALTFIIVTQPSFGYLSNTPPHVVYIPKPDYNGSDEFTFRVSDGVLDSTIATVTITNTPVNDAPVADAQLLTTPEDTQLNLVLSGSDVEGDLLSYPIASQPTNGTLSGSVPNLIYQPASNFSGLDSFTVQVNDGALSSSPALIVISVTSINDQPIVDAGVDQFVSLPTNSASLAGTVDDDSYFETNSLNTVWSVVTGPGAVTFSDATALATTATFSSNGIYLLRLSASDWLLEDEDELQVTLNGRPTVTAGPNQTVTYPNSVTLNGYAIDDGLPVTGTLAAGWTKVSGPGTVYFVDAQSTNTAATFSDGGVYVLRLTVTDSVVEEAAEVIITVNKAPIVDAGSAQTNSVLQAELAATVVDDGFPADAQLSYQWSQTSGPGAAVFTHPTNLTTSVSFPQSGIYVLRFTADDSLVAGAGEVTLVVNAAPEVHAGPDLRVTVGQEVQLHGVVSDDGLPASATPTVHWSLVEGIGQMGFVEPESATTAAYFNEIGTYVVRLTASDSLTNGFDEATITVLPMNRAPVVIAGPRQLVMQPGTATLLATVTDDGLPENASLSLHWSKVSGPGTVSFSNLTTTNTTAMFSEVGDYVLRLTVTDSELIGFAETTVSVRTPAMNLAPTANAGADLVVGLTNQVIITGAITDDGLPQGTTLNGVWTKVSGPGTVTFTPGFTSGTQAVTTASFGALGAYTLRFTASDSELSHSDEVQVTVYPYNQPPLVDAGSNQIVVLPDPELLYPNPFGVTNVNVSLSRSVLSVDRWNNTIGQPGLDNYVARNSIAIADSVFVTGTFQHAGGTEAHGSARWDGSSWHRLYDPRPHLNDNYDPAITNIAYFVYDCGTFYFCNQILDCVGARGQEAFVAGLGKNLAYSDGFKDPTARWSGTGWESWVYKWIGGGQLPRVIIATSNLVYLGGGFIFQPTNATDQVLTNLPTYTGVATWDGTNWGTLGAGLTNIDYYFPSVFSMAVTPSGKVYTGGTFRMPTTNGLAENIVYWNGTNWLALGPGITGGLVYHNIYGQPYTNSPQINALALAENGDLYVGGTFTNAGGYPVRNIARWDGTRWWPMGDGSANGVNGTVEAIAIHGRDVYVGGSFSEAGGFSASRIARWNGQFWAPLGNGSTNGTLGSVLSLAADDTGLYVGGLFSKAGGLPANNIARWEFAPPPTKTVELRGLVTDDGLPTSGQLTRQWTKVSGPGEVQFAAATSSLTTAAFSKAGTYVLRLSATDSELTGQDEVTITIRANQPPVVAAGPDQVIGLEEPLVLNGFVSDDALPESAPVHHVWQQIYGPGTVTFDNTANTNVTARFSQQGTYVLRLTANDSQFSTADEVTVIVRPRNQPPAVYPGAFTIITLGNTHKINATVTDDGAPTNSTISVAWSVVSGPGKVTFDNASLIQPTVSFSTNGVYLLRISASDSELTTAGQVQITVNLPANTPPVVDAGPAQTITNLVTALAGTVSDDGNLLASALGVSWSKQAGPGTVFFASSNSPTTAVSFSLQGNYTLRLTATDGTYTVSDTVVITIANQPPVVVTAGPDRTITLPTNSVQLTGFVQDSGAPAYSWARLSGPGSITYAAASTLTPTLTFTTAGTNIIRLRVTDGGVNYDDTMTLVVAPSGNKAPAVNAGADQTLRFPTNTIILSGTVSDDGFPSGSTLNWRWSQVAGPEAASFSDPSALDSQVQLPAFGTYLFRLLADDGALTNGDDLVVTLGPVVNLPPIVSAGPDQTTRVTNTVTLAGLIADDAAPTNGMLAAFWREISGPGKVTFSSATSSSMPATNLLAQTTASFSLPGTYVLRLEANDSELNSYADLTITVLEVDDNHAPVVNAGLDAHTVVFNPFILSGAVSDDGLPSAAGVSVLWNVVSGPARVYFSDATALQPYAQFTAPGTFVLRLVAHDSRLTTTDDIVITVSAPTNQPPFVFAGLPLEVTRPTPALLQGLVLDDGLPIGYPVTATWSKLSGPGSVTFYPSANDPLALAYFSVAGEYTLRLLADDSEYQIADAVTITVWPGTNAPPTVDAGPDFTAALAEPTFLTTSVTDDGLEEGLLQVSWQQLSGPGNVSFSTVNGDYRASFPTEGEYTLRLTAHDGSLTNRDDVTVTIVDAGPPVAAIIWPGDGASITAPTAVVGTASSAILQSYVLEYRLAPPDSLSAGGEGQGEVASWSLLSSNTTSVISNTLAVFDPTLLLNGIYEVQLTATDLAGRTALSEIQTVIVDRNLKIGHFTVSFNDLAVPVPGLPLQFTRTYDSRAAAAGIQGDFGIGWTLDIRNVRLQKNRSLSRNWEQTVTGSPWDLSLAYHLNGGKPRIVTITFPDGRVEKFQFLPNPMDQALLPIDYPQWRFIPLGNTRGSLVPAGYDDPDGRFLYFAGSIPGTADLYDLNYFTDWLFGSGTEEDLLRHPTLFRYSTPEGYKYLIDEIAGLQSVTDPNGNTLLIGTNGLTWTNSLAGTNSLSIAFQRDSLGRITNIVDAAGHATTYAYNNASDLITYTDRVGQTNGFAYTNTVFPHHLTGIVDGRGTNALQSLYDDAGRIVATLDAAGNAMSYGNDVANRRQSVTNRLGYVTLNEYDDLGRVIRKTDPVGLVTGYSYDAFDNLLSVSNSTCNCANHYTYDDDQNLTSETDELGRVSTYTYTSRGKVLTYTDADGNATTNAYDGRGNLLATRDPLGNITSFTYNEFGSVLTMTDPRGGVTQFQYDSHGRLTNEINALGHATSYEVDANGSLRKQTRSRTLDFQAPLAGVFGPGAKTMYCDPPGPVRQVNLVYTYTYDSGGHLISALLPDGSSISNRFNAIGRIDHSTDQLGQVTVTTFNGIGKPSRVSYPDGTSEAMAYDAEGQLTLHTDRGGRQTQFNYDPAGRLSRVTYPDGRTVTAAYDLRGRLTAEADSCQGTTTYTYDAVGNRISSTDVLGHTSTYTYNTKRACTSVTDALGRTTSMEYDALNRNTRITYPNATSKSATYLGRLVTSITDQDGQASRFGYDAVGRLTTSTNASGNTLRFQRDELGNLVTQTDPHGETTFHDYDDQGRRLRTVRPDGSAQQFGYDALGRMTASTNAVGSISLLGYNARNNIAAVTNALGEVTRFTYNALGQRTTSINAAGQVTTWQYDSAGRLVSTHYPDGSTETTEYDSCSRISAILDRAGGRTTYAYDALSRVTSITDPLNQANAFGYDAVGNLTSQRDAAGQVTQFLYDSLNRRAGMVLPDGTSVSQAYDARGRIASRTDAVGQATTYGYDANGRLASVTDPLGYSLRYGYDARGQLDVITNALGFTTAFAYDENGRRTQTIRPDGSTRTTTYDARGLVSAETDALGHTTHYSYDALGRLTAVTNALGLTTLNSYDSLGRLVSTTDANGHVTAYQYDALGMLTNTVYADGTSESSAYDLAGRRVSNTDARGNTTRFGYDALGRLTGVTNALNEVTAFNYDMLGRRTETVDALGRVTRFEYDSQGRMTRTVFADATAMSYLYDAAGRRTATVDEAGITNFFGYDALGRLTSVTNALGHVTDYNYDVLGRMTSQTDANGHTTAFEYDAMNRRVRRTLPGGGFETYAYDPEGNLTNRVDFNGRHCAYTYDPLNRPIQKTPDAFFAEPPVTWAYDAVGLRTNMTDASGATAYFYDNRYRLVQKTRVWSDSGHAVALQYAYDPAGNLTNVLSTSTNGVALTYDYDALNRLSTVQDPLNGVTAYAYDPVGNMAALSRANGLQTLYGHDTRDRATNIVTIDASLAVLNQYLYTHGPAGNRLSAAEIVAPGGPANTIAHTYSYDAAYRLTNESLSINAQLSALSYAYDPVGNRLSRLSSLDSIPSASHGYDADDQLMSDSYDANGNTLAATVTDPYTGLPVAAADSYDHANRLVQRSTTLNGQAATLNFQYDGDGNRVGKTVGGVTTHFLVDEINPTGWPQVLEEQTWNIADPLFVTPAVTRVYAYGHAALTQDQLSGNAWSATHFGHDAHGNVRTLSDLNGQITDRLDYDAFGNVIARSGSTPVARLFTGEELDGHLGLYNLRARYQNPGTGRFWTRDSFEGYAGDPASRHGYAYAQNDPVNRVDPGGHFALAESMAVSGLSMRLQPMLDQLWKGLNNYTHGLGGGEALKANNAVEGQFIQSLSQHVGINLGRGNFFATMQGAPFLLAHNPYVFALRNDCYRYEVLGFDANAPLYGCPNRNPVFTPFESPLLDELLDFGHGSFVGATLRELAADYAALGQQGSGNLGTLENFAHNVTSQLLGMAGGAVSPTTIKEGVTHMQDRAAEVMAREILSGGSGFEAVAQGASTLVGDVVGYNGILEGAYGVDRASLEALSGVDRIERSGQGLFSLGTLGAMTASKVAEAAKIVQVNRLAVVAADTRAARTVARAVAEEPTPIPFKGLDPAEPCPGVTTEKWVQQEFNFPSDELLAAKPTPITDPSRLLPAPRGLNPDLPGGPIFGVELPAGFRFNQAVSAGQNAPGAYGTLANIPDIAFVRNDLAVIPQFKPVISGSRVVEVTRPVRAQFSIVGPQVQNGVLYPGGEWQLRILEYDPKNPFVQFVNPENALH
jgi:RHS repeat-associated protein